MSEILISSVFLLITACAHTLEKKDHFAKNSVALPSNEMKRLMVESLKKEIDRIDGDGLLPRSNRSESWDNTVSRLAEEAASASTLYDLGRVFKRFDATYPNLHARVFLIPELNEQTQEGSVTLPFKFYADKVDQKNESHRYFVVMRDRNNKKSKKWR